MSADQDLLSLPCGLCDFSTPATGQANMAAMVELLKLHQTQIHQNNAQKSGPSSNSEKVEEWINNSETVYIDPSDLGGKETTYKALSEAALYENPYNSSSSSYHPLSDIGTSTSRSDQLQLQPRRNIRGDPNQPPSSNRSQEQLRSVSQNYENRPREPERDFVYEEVQNQHSQAGPFPEPVKKRFCFSKKWFIMCTAILIPLAGVLSVGGYFYSDESRWESLKMLIGLADGNDNSSLRPRFGIDLEQEDNLVFSVCGFSNNQGNKLGQVTYDRYFSNTNGFEPETGAVAAPSEGIYLVNFYSHIDSGTPTFQTIQDPKDYYSAYIRLNGENLEFEGHLKSSLVGNNEYQDDVTTGRNLVLHLNEGDEVDVGLDKVMPNGAGLTHSSFCMVEIARTKRNAIYSCGFKSTHGNKIGVVTYDRHLTNRNGFGNEESLDLNQGSFVAPVEGVYLINFDTHFDNGRGPTSKKFNVVFRKNGLNILEQLSIRTSMHGSDDNHDDVTTGRSITLHLKKYDQIDVFVEEVIPVGAGLTHSSFCVTLIHLIEADTQASAFCGFMSGPVNSEGVLTYDRVFTRVDEYNYGGLNRQTGVFKAPKKGTYLVNFDTQVDSGPGPSVTSKQEYYSARKNGEQLQFEGHVKSSVVGTDGFHVDVITGRSIVLHLMGSDEIDIEVNNIMVDGKGFYNATFCVTLIRADKDETEE
eukprot:GFUD01126917.1.p1 GENE.GFUD01126917.1~~GFUD01126917.1.p1  ORF type:complete len:698 (+),score=135.08 GFUD01126917.1:76-2169(+)